MKKSLMIVDDDQSFAAMLCVALKHKDYEVMCFTSPEAALDYALKRQPHVMITDWLMPGMDGLELAKRVREADPFIQVIMMSVDPSLESIVQMHDIGIFDYLIKPPDLKQLRLVVKEAFVHSDRWRTSLGNYSKSLKLQKKAPL